ncbi:hypothetical protein ABL78_0619 [Leptomonas seymouri]|uniref:Transmembrane protein n=1 Tax=Leptomonas seymouri TaxID=5684 RepID=A0A0N0P934_LEPSE|nr:hypothetical protein ABL78_0619 [Leptomonas seymouri]|eukprot:KPI90237.1 hypothetical protein ABL78_0619 [Leptomonas seymouri]
MREAPNVGEAGCPAPVAGSTSASSSGAAPVLYRHHKSTFTPEFHNGGDVQYHLQSPSRWHLLFMLGTPILCLLNGCSYYVFWRYRYLEESATLPSATHSAESPYSPTLPSSTIMFLSNGTYVAPSAFYAAAGGYAFSFLFTQWVVQESARVFIRVQAERERAASFRRCGLLFVITFLPSTVAQLVLISQDFHLCKDKSVLLHSLDENSVSGTSDTVCAHLSAAPHRSVALWIVSFFLTTLTMVIVASAMWTNAAVSWLQRQVAAAYQHERMNVGRAEN